MDTIKNGTVLLIRRKKNEKELKNFAGMFISIANTLNDRTYVTIRLFNRGKPNPLEYLHNENSQN